MKSLYILSIFCAGLLLSCSDTNDENTDSSEDQASKESFDSRIRREIQTALEIPATEKYSLRIYREYINSDTTQDAIITVNRKEFAIAQSIKSKTEVKTAEMGYIGKYNFFFYYDGALDKISVPLPITSSPGRELDIQFRPITGKTKMDVMIDYRLRNSGYRNYYTVLNEKDLALVFQWNVFDLSITNGPNAYIHDFVPSPDGIGYDIAIYQSQIDNVPIPTQDIYQYVPSITKRNELMLKFFFERRAGKFGLYKEFVPNIKRLQ